jgi:hypothetical protein
VNEFTCPACPWIVGAVVMLAFVGILWRSHRARITRMDMRAADRERDDDQARKAGL